MGVIKNGYLKGVSGKVGNIIVSKWKDIDVVKGLSDIRNTTATEDQLVQRNRFKKMIEFSNLMKYPVILPVWKGISRNMTAANLFVKANAEAFNDEGEIDDYSKLLMTRGDIEEPTELSIVNDNKGEKKLVFEWTFDSLYAPLSVDDKVNLIIFKKGDESKRPRLLYNFSSRNETKAELIVDEYEEGDELNVFAFHSRDGFKLFSDSVFKKVIIDFSVVGA